MKQIEITELMKRHRHQQALFFTKEGKIILKNNSPLLPIGTTLDQLRMGVQAAYKNEHVLIVHLNEENLFASDITFTAPRDYFLSLKDKPKIEEVILKATHWMISHGTLQFCSRCGGPLQKDLETTEKKCTQCQLSFFPKLSPAVLISIQRGDEILLARGPRHQPGIFTLLSGFIDLGESAEQAAHREVREEVGLEITDLKYVGSQSWPFPDSFMIAFEAEYLSGDIKIDPHELEEARWFHRDAMPLLPPASTLSRKAIDRFLMKQK